ncbi:hypothetical protein Tco_0808345 [Tanacetum coccineum]
MIIHVRQHPHGESIDRVHVCPWCPDCTAAPLSISPPEASPSTTLPERLTMDNKLYLEQFCNNWKAHIRLDEKLSPDKEDNENENDLQDSWKSSKQTVIAKSMMESEFITLDKCEEEAEWLRKFVEDIPRWPKPVTSISIHCDSQSAIDRAQSTMYNGKSRHICRRHNSIRQLLSTGVISIDYVASKDNIADPFTKGLSRELVSKSSKGMGLKPLKE